MDEARKSKQFRCGILLAWAPMIPLMYGCFKMFRGVSEQKATGLGAVAGGLAASLLVYGLLALVATEVYAIVLLSRSASGGGFGRSLVSVLSIAWCVVVLLWVSFAVWFFYIKRPFAT
jgi:hypothetical protein